MAGFSHHASSRSDDDTTNFLNINTPSAPIDGAVVIFVGNDFSGSSEDFVCDDPNYIKRYQYGSTDTNVYIACFVRPGPVAADNVTISWNTEQWGVAQSGLLIDCIGEVNQDDGELETVASTRHDFHGRRLLTDQILLLWSAGNGSDCHIITSPTADFRDRGTISNPIGAAATGIATLLDEYEGVATGTIDYDIEMQASDTAVLAYIAFKHYVAPIPTVFSHIRDGVLPAAIGDIDGVSTLLYSVDGVLNEGGTPPPVGGVPSVIEAFDSVDQTAGDVSSISLPIPLGLDGDINIAFVFSNSATANGAAPYHISANVEWIKLGELIRDTGAAAGVCTSVWYRLNENGYLGGVSDTFSLGNPSKRMAGASYRISGDDLSVPLMVSNEGTGTNLTLTPQTLPAAPASLDAGVYVSGAAIGLGNRDVSLPTYDADTQKWTQDVLHRGGFASGLSVAAGGLYPGFDLTANVDCAYVCGSSDIWTGMMVYVGNPAVVEPPVAPVAEFVGVPTNVVQHETVQFTDQSTNNPTSWAWTFQNGTPPTSTQQNPLITYDFYGGGSADYDVSLTATNASGSDDEDKFNYIIVSPAP